MEEAPDPTETVVLLRSDYELLQRIADVAVQDVGALAELLSLPCPEGTAPREHYHLVLLPAVARLAETQAQVNLASSAIAERASRFGNKTIEHAGVKGLKVGQKDPELARLLALQRPESRRERRERERNERR